jgi:hypothetical protein
MADIVVLLDVVRCRVIKKVGKQAKWNATVRKLKLVSCHMILENISNLTTTALERMIVESASARAASWTSSHQNAALVGCIVQLASFETL